MFTFKLTTLAGKCQADGSEFVRCARVELVQYRYGGLKYGKWGVDLNAVTSNLP